MLGLVLLLSAGCVEQPAPVPAEESTLRFTDDNNYTLSRAGPVFDVLEGAELYFDWSALVVQESSFAGVDAVYLIRADLPPECVLMLMATDELGQQHMTGAWTADKVRGNRVCLGDFADLDSAGLYCEAGTSWLLYLVEDGGTLGPTVLDPCSGGTLEQVDIWNPPPGPAELLAADFSATEPFQVPAGTVPTLDWSELSTDAVGRQLEPDTVRTLHLSRHGLSPDELEEEFVSALEAPLESYQAGVAWLSSADLRACKDEDDQHFEGFTTDGLWLISLETDHCPPLAAALVDVTGF